jgi:hypothetical protein
VNTLYFRKFGVGVGKFGLGVRKSGVGLTKKKKKKKEGKNAEKSQKYRVIQQFRYKTQAWGREFRGWGYHF